MDPSPGEDGTRDNRYTIDYDIADEKDALYAEYSEEQERYFFYTYCQLKSWAQEFVIDENGTEYPLGTLFIDNLAQGKIIRWSNGSSGGSFEIQENKAYLILRKMAGASMPFDLLLHLVSQEKELLGIEYLKPTRVFFTKRVGYSGCQDYKISLDITETGLLINPSCLHVSMNDKLNNDSLFIRKDHMINFLAQFGSARDEYDLKIYDVEKPAYIDYTASTKK
jgi:hypothetical protein